MVIEIDSLSLTEIIRLQEQLSSSLHQRFERKMAVAFSDMVESTAYFSKYGDEAGQRLQQRHVDFLLRIIPPSGGRIVDTAGDGALLCFPHLETAWETLARLQQIILQDNAARPRDQHLQVRAGIHWGKVLTDDVILAGEAVNVCAHLTQTTANGEIWVTKSTFLELSLKGRLCCRPIPPVPLKGLSEPVEVFVLEWRGSEVPPDTVEIQETGETIALPDKERITFGRLGEGERDGLTGNDIVLSLADHQKTQQISRWHFELLRESGNLLFHLTSPQLTEVNDCPMAKDTQVPIYHGTVVRIPGILTLRFFAQSSDTWHSNETIPLTLNPKRQV